MELWSLHITLLILTAEAAAFTFNLNFVENYMTMYKLKFPLLVFHPVDMDMFYVANTTFQTFSCLCYEEGILLL